MSGKCSLPISSYEEIVKIITAYCHQNGPASLSDISNLTGMNKTIISANNKFLVESGVISTGHKKEKTDLGKRLGRALEHDQKVDIRSCWKEIVSNHEVFADLTTTVRIKKGMPVEELASHTLYVSEQKNTAKNRTGANTIIEILRVSGLIIDEDGKFIVSVSENGEIENPMKENITPQSTEKTSQSRDQQLPQIEAGKQSRQQVVPPSSPQIAINIQLHLPATNDPEIYENLFKALRENLLD